MSVRSTASHWPFLTGHPDDREADGRVQHQSSPGIQEDRACTNGYVRVSIPRSAVVNATLGIWEAMEMLNKLVDDSDPDVR